MERVNVLIDKLNKQRSAGESPDQLLITVQLLQQELFKLQKPVANAATSKVSIVMPAPRVFEDDVKPPKEEKKEVFELKMDEVTDDKGEDYSPEPIEYFLQKPHVPDKIKTPSSPVEEKKPVYEERKQKDLFSYDAMAETPTLIQHQPNPKEIHESISQNKGSLNDQLKQDKKELAHMLKDSPIKDLRKAIGVNDKFVFINDLFRGDEDMYERSIRTINSFHILPEAEYWMNRELKVILGWNDNNSTVQHFYQLVRRRFS
ncbi:MAG: hypothetical protein H0V91_08210 [Flavisolibacter sp.]|jgi:hypothetical protein|nr:hypothetical protein [Flavisolibacter sp.]